MTNLGVNQLRSRGFPGAAALAETVEHCRPGSLPGGGLYHFGELNWLTELAESGVPAPAEREERLKRFDDRCLIAAAVLQRASLGLLPRYRLSETRALEQIFS
jgi:hypothetical protein